MRRLFPLVLLSLFLAAGCAARTTPTVAYLTAMEARMLSAVGSAISVLDTAAMISRHVRRGLDIAPLPRRVVVTIYPVLNDFDREVTRAVTALMTSVTPDDVHRTMGPVVTARTALANILRRYDELADLRVAVDLMPKALQ